MEERLCVAAARMGEHTAEEMKKGHFFPGRMLGNPLWNPHVLINTFYGLPKCWC
jgi:hypothetical protein